MRQLTTCTCLERILKPVKMFNTHKMSKRIIEQNNEDDCVFDQEEDAVYPVIQEEIGSGQHQKLCRGILIGKANIEAHKIFGPFGFTPSPNPFTYLNDVFNITTDDRDRTALYYRKEDLVYREKIGKYLLLYNHVYSRFRSPAESFNNGKFDDLFLNKLSYLEMKVTFEHNPLYLNYEHSVSRENCCTLASHIEVYITPEQYFYGFLYAKKDDDFPFISFAEFEEEQERHGVRDDDITKWNIFGPNVLRGHQLEHIDPYTNCLATLTLKKERYNIMKVILCHENLRLRIKITKNTQKRQYEVTTYSLMATRLVIELFFAKKDKEKRKSKIDR